MKQTVVESSPVAVVGDPSGNPQLADGAGDRGAAVAVVVVAVVMGVAAALGHRTSSLVFVTNENPKNGRERGEDGVGKP